MQQFVWYFEQNRDQLNTICLLNMFILVANKVYKYFGSVVI